MLHDRSKITQTYTHKRIFVFLFHKFLEYAHHEAVWLSHNKVLKDKTSNKNESFWLAG